jgi:hypothetical protein
MSALTITHQIAAPLQVIPDELGLTAKNLTIAAGVLDIVDAATFEAGNALLIKAHATVQALEKQRKTMTGPINDLKKQIDAVVASVAEPLEAAKKAMQNKVAVYQRQEFAKAEKARQEAEAKAAKERAEAEHERARLQAVADELHRQQVAAAKEKAEQEAKDLEAVLGAPVEAAPVVVAPAPVIQAAPVAAVVPVAAAPIASAVQTRRVQRVEFTDRMLVPINCGIFILRPIDEAAVKRALLAGAVIPGVRLIEVDQIAMARA